MTWAEGLRKLAHMAAFWPALLLPWLTPMEAMSVAFALVILNVFILPRVAGILYRPEEPGKGALEIVLYPTALMACIAAFGLEAKGPGLGKPAWYLPVAAAWFGLAFVDAFIGMACRLFPLGPVLPWNPRKPIPAAIVGALLVCLPAYLLANWAAHSGLLPAPASALPGWTKAWGWLAGLVLVCALAETAWFGIADNIVVPFALSMALALFPTPLSTAAAPATTELWSSGSIAFVFGMASFMGGLLTLGGSVLGALLAFLLLIANPWLFAFLGGFFVLGNAATRLGFKRKQRLGIAEARGGKRGAAEVFGAMGLAAWMTPLVHLAGSGSGSDDRIARALLICVAPLVAKTMDTVSSEIGKALAGRTLSLRSFHIVPPGSVGGVSLWGTLSGLAAAMVLALPIPALGWGGWKDVAALLTIALAANVFESHWSEWAGRKGMNQGAHANVLMTLVAAVLAWVWWFGLG